MPKALTVLLIILAVGTMSGMIMRVWQLMW